MATSNILGLFTSPEEYQAQQMGAEQQRALGFAQLSPMQLANYNLFMGGQQLGRGIGGLLGVQDPQLQRIRQRQEIMQSINPADPQSLMAGIQRASEMNDPELALSLTDYMNKQASEIALAKQRSAEKLGQGIQEAARIAEIERLLPTLDSNSVDYKALVAERTRLQRSAKAATATEKERDAIAYANTISDDPESAAWKDAYKTRLDRLQLGKEGVERKSAFAQQLEDAGYIPGSPMYVSMMDKFLAKELMPKEASDKKSAFAQQLEDAGYIPGSPSYVSMMDKFLAKELLPKEDKGVSFGTDREAIAYELYGKPFKDLTQSQKAIVNKRKEDEEQRKKPTTEVKLLLPGEGKQGAKEIPQFRNEVVQSIKPYRDTVNATDNALTSINDSIRTGNFISFNAARVQLAKALGDSTLSRRDIEQAGGDPSLIGGFFDAASTLFTGTPSVDTQKKIQSTLKAIQKVARNKAISELDRQRKIAERAKYTKEDIELIFDFPEFKGGVSKPSGGGGGGGGNRVDFNALPKK